MQILDLAQLCIKEYEKGKVLKSVGGLLEDLTEREQEIVNDFENSMGYKVYHVVYTKINDNEHYSLLFVGTNQEEWKEEELELRARTPFVYVHNESDKICSEFGMISVENKGSGIIRNY